MIDDNKAPALAGKTVPLSDEDAEARITEFTSSENNAVTGLIGLTFKDAYQFQRAMRQNKWKLDLDVLMHGIPGRAITYTGQGSTPDGKTIRLVLHSYGESIEIINADTGA